MATLWRNRYWTADAATWADGTVWGPGEIDGEYAWASPDDAKRIAASFIESLKRDAPAWFVRNHLRYLGPAAIEATDDGLRMFDCHP